MVCLPQPALCRIAEWEWARSSTWIGCTTDREAALELTLPLLPRRVSDLSNRFRRACKQLGVLVEWDPPTQPQASYLPGTIAVLSRQTRWDRSLLAESITSDKTLLQQRINTSLQALHRHSVLTVDKLTLPVGK